jgi:hypothetical protein
MLQDQGFEPLSGWLHISSSTTAPQAFTTIPINNNFEEIMQQKHTLKARTKCEGID